MKWLLLIPGVILGLLLIALIRTLLMPGKKAEYTPQESEEESLRLAEKLSKMVQYDTTSHAGTPEPEKFRGFHKTLESCSPWCFPGWKRLTWTAICCFIGRESTATSPFCS